MRPPVERAPDGAAPRRDGSAPGDAGVPGRAPTDAPLLSIEDVVVRFPAPRTLADRLARRPVRAVHALNGVRLALRRGETLGLVGESGCGKSTLARAAVRLLALDDGRIRFEGRDLAEMRGRDALAFSRRAQMVFQDPYGSLNPRMTVGQTVGEALRVHRMREGRAVPGRVAELIDLVRLPADSAGRYPHQFSGGQRQRIGIARALAVEPDLLVADELVSALDVSVQAQVVNLLLDLQARLGLTVLFVAHDLRLVRHISHRVAVMYLGAVMEEGPTEALFAGPRHPYTRALLDAAPDLDPARRPKEPAARGELPSPLSPPSGCPFHTRCPLSFDRCRTERPELSPRGPDHRAACHLDGYGLP